MDNGSSEDFLEILEINGEFEMFINDVIYGFIDVFLGLYYKFKIG